MKAVLFIPAMLGIYLESKYALNYVIHYTDICVKVIKSEK